MAGAVGDVSSVDVNVGDIGVRGGCAVLFLGAAGDRFVATDFGLGFCLFVALVFFLAFQKCRRQGWLDSASAHAEKIKIALPLHYDRSGA